MTTDPDTPAAQQLPPEIEAQIEHARQHPELDRDSLPPRQTPRADEPTPAEKMTWAEAYSRSWRDDAADAIRYLSTADIVEQQALAELCAALRSGLKPAQRRRAAMALLSDPDTSVVTRLEVIDDADGRVWGRWNVTVELQLQDDDRTLKVFVGEREPEPGYQ